MTRTTKVWAILGLATLAPAAPLLAQRSPYLGASAGVSGIPAAYTQNCGPIGDSGPVVGLGGSARAGLPIGSKLALEGRLAAWEIEPQTCLAIPIRHPDGVHTDRFPHAFLRSPLYAHDLRLRVEPYPSWTLTGGAGWMWHPRDPYLVGGLGWRWGRRLRIALDVELAAYRVTTLASRREWRDGQVVEELFEGRDDVWRTGLGVHLGIEAGLRR